MLPIFKSHYSIGKSILTLDEKKSSLDDGPDSIFVLAQKLELKELILVEDHLTGFLQALNGCKKAGLKLIFGLRMLVCNDTKQEDLEKSIHKVIIFPKSSEGCKILNQLSTCAQTQNNGVLDFSIINKMWDKNHLKMVIPFYDSFIFNNCLKFGNCIPDFSQISPEFIIESNQLPFDSVIKNLVESFCKNNNLKTLNAKSIYYNTRDDFDSYVAYKCICNRKQFSSSLDKPNFDHLGSREFCLESWIEQSR